MTQTQQKWGYIYRVTHLPTKKYYIGKRNPRKQNISSPLEDLGVEYFTSAKSNNWIQEDLKSNPQDWKLEILEERVEDPIELSRLEGDYIHSCIDDDLCMNAYDPSKSNGWHTTGLSWKQSEETIAKRVATRRALGNYKTSDEVKRKLRESHIGKKRSTETIEKQRQKMIGKKHSEEAKQKNREAMQGRHYYTNGKENVLAYECPEGYWEGATWNYSEETLKKKGDATRGKKFYTDGVRNTLAYECPDGWWEGMTRKITDEERKRRSEAAKKQIKTPESIKKQSDKMKLKRWYTNGETCVFAESCPEGFVPGRKIK